MFCMGKLLFALFNAGAAILMGALLVACLDIPDAPNTSSVITGASVVVEQFGKQDSTLRKINSNESSALIAKVRPSKYKDDVSYYWYNDQELIDSGRTFPISSKNALAGQTNPNRIPNKVVIHDQDGNSIEREFTVIINAPPMLSETTIPSDGDTLIGDSHTAFLFKWSSSDNDRNQLLEHVITIDHTNYAVGELNEIRQSGLAKGKHSFRVIVTDPLGDSDTTSIRTFYVKESSGGKQ